MYSTEIMEYYEKAKAMSAESTKQYHLDHKFGKTLRYLRRQYKLGWRAYDIWKEMFGEIAEDQVPWLQKITMKAMYEGTKEWI